MSEDSPLTSSTSKLAVVLILFLVLFLALSQWDETLFNPQMLKYDQFLRLLSQRQLSQVVLSGDWIEGKALRIPQREPLAFRTPRLEDPSLISRLESSQVDFAGRGAEAHREFYRGVAWFFVIGLMLSFWVFMLRRVGSAMQPSSLMQMSRSRARVYSELKPQVRFADVAGVDEAKAELEEVVHFLREPKKYQILGGRMPKGVLLVGPPGTGKTLLARAVAGEAGVPFFSMNGSEFVEMFVGLGAARVRDLFAQARERLPSIIFIDELDALGRARGMSMHSGGPHEEKEQTLQQLLAEIDGFDSSQGVILLAATNRPEVLDPALLRAGRFDRRILVDRPDRKGRAEILQLHLRKVRMETQFDVAALASLTTGFSGADLAHLVNEAALAATRRGAERVAYTDALQALERVVAGTERKSRILTPAERLRVAYHEMGHAVVALALGQTEVIHKMSIIPRGLHALGYTLSIPKEDQYLFRKKELELKLAVALGGRASEVEFLGESSTGARDDLEKVTEIARSMVTLYGMSEEVGLGVYSQANEGMLGGGPHLARLDYSEGTAQQIDSAMKRIIERASHSARIVIQSYPEMIKEGVQVLLREETLNEHQLHEIWLKHQDSSPARRLIS